VPTVYVDGDACPVKEEIYRVARRHGVDVKVVANATMRVPAEDRIALVVVPGGFDAADDWIAEQAGPADVVVTADIPLAERALKKGARVLDPRGRVFTEDRIGEAMATRALMEMLRQGGEFTGGPSAFAKTDRSRFLAKLDELLHAVAREARRRPPAPPS
jgi:uncharacterized protein YaiI (UPF0178 family)